MTDEQDVAANSHAKLRNSTTVFFVGNIEPAMEWYKRLGFESRYYPPGFAILRRDAIEIFLQQKPDYMPPDDPERREREAWNVYIITDYVKALFEEYSASGVEISRPLCAQDWHDGIRRDGSQWTPARVRAPHVKPVIRIAPRKKVSDTEGIEESPARLSGSVIGNSE
jgi:uncharacterized glyoxalase superfamily protein PhnB